MRAREKIGFVLLIVVTALVSGWVFERYVDHRADRYAGSERLAPARFANYFYGGQGAGSNEGHREGSVPDDFCAPAAKAIPATVHVLAAIGERGLSSGSGVVISDDGYIVTNNHVIERANDVRVTLSNRRELHARVVGTDADADLAVLKIDAQSLPFLLFGNSNDVRVGQWVLAVGYPFSLESTVTAGIISAKGQGLVPRQPETMESFLETDAAVNFGNSGGPLVDVSGEIVGINTAMATPTGVYTGYSFAIPGNIAEKIVKEIIKGGGVKGR